MKKNVHEETKKIAKKIATSLAKPYSRDDSVQKDLKFDKKKDVNGIVIKNKHRNSCVRARQPCSPLQREVDAVIPKKYWTLCERPPLIARVPCARACAHPLSSKSIVIVIFANLQNRSEVPPYCTTHPRIIHSVTAAKLLNGLVWETASKSSMSAIVLCARAKFIRSAVARALMACV